MSKSELARLAALVPEIEELRASVQAARDYIVEISGGNIGGGNKPVEFLIAAHRLDQLRLERLAELVRAGKELQKYSDRGRVDALANMRFRMAIAALK